MDKDFSVFKPLSLERRIILFIMWNFCSFDQFVINQYRGWNILIYIPFSKKMQKQRILLRNHTGEGSTVMQQLLTIKKHHLGSVTSIYDQEINHPPVTTYESTNIKALIQLQHGIKDTILRSPKWITSSMIFLAHAKGPQPKWSRLLSSTSRSQVRSPHEINFEPR
jgi:hypothetical protein